MKLFRNLPGIQFEGRIHEQILASLRPHGEIARIPGAVVLHSGYDTSNEGQKKKRVRDEKLLTMDLEERPEHPFVLFNLGMTAHFCSEHQTAIEWLRSSIKRSGEGDSHVRKAYALMGASHRYLGELEKALEVFTEGKVRVGGDPELDFQSGITLCELGRFAEAKQRYLEMPLDTSGFFSSIDVGILGYKRSANIGRVCLALGEYMEAKEWLLKAFEQNPGAQDIALELVHAALERGDLRTAQSVLDQVKASCGPTESWADLQARLMEMRGESPDTFLWNMARMHPCAVGPRLVLTRRLLGAGFEQEAAPHLEILDGLGCAEAAYFRAVSATRTGDFTRALVHMERAAALNPNHEPTREQVAALRQAVGAGA